MSQNADKSDSKRQRLTRASRFSYQCNRCMSCCHGAHITLTPYETVRLARRLQLSTTEFIARYLYGGGIVLRNREDGACVMLGDGECTVYTDRPLICRTYPLLRASGAAGEEFVRFKPLPTTKGVYGDNGTVGAFLEADDIDALVDVSERYLMLVQRIVRVLAEIVRLAPDLFPAVRNAIDSHCEYRTEDVPALIDVDRVVNEYCNARSIDVPGGVDELIAMHIDIIEEKLAAFDCVTSSPGSTASGESADLRAVLEMAALAGALAAGTGARVMLMFAAAVMGEPEQFHR